MAYSKLVWGGVFLLTLVLSGVLLLSACGFNDPLVPFIADNNGKTVTFNPNNGEKSIDVKVNRYSVLAPPVFYPENCYKEYYNVNWYKENSLTNEWNFGVDVVTENITLYAKWTPTKDLGDTGPGGGKIFYRSDTGFTIQSYGEPGDSYYFKTYIAYYLEVAPEINGSVQWASSSTYLNYDIPGTSQALGTGRKNTSIILGIDTAAPAALLCRNYNGGSKTDWFLPSRTELNRLMDNRAYVGNISLGSHWTSSQASNTQAYSQSYDSTDYTTNKRSAYTYLTRAVRAF